MNVLAAIECILEEMQLQREQLGVNHSWWSASRDLEGIRLIHERRLTLQREVLSDGDEIHEL